MVYLQNSLTKCVVIKQHTTLIIFIHYGLLIGLTKNAYDGCKLLSVLVGWGWTEFFVYYGAVVREISKELRFNFSASYLFSKCSCFLFALASYGV
jgi:hypothetical protein